VQFSEGYHAWKEHNKSNPTRLVVGGRPTEIRADALIAAALTTSCCAFMCEVLEYHADYLLDSGNAGEAAIQNFDRFAEALANETHHNKWLPGLQAISLSEEEHSDALWRAARKTVSDVRGKFERLAWKAERERTDEAIYSPPRGDEASSRAVTGDTPKQEGPGGNGAAAIAAGPAAPSDSKTHGRRRGPKPDYANASRVAEIVARVAPDGDWRPKFDEICEALDQARIPCPSKWLSRYKAASWSEYPEKSIGVKAIVGRLELAKPKPKPVPETFS
jgi:hypothetical protein